MWAYNFRRCTLLTHQAAKCVNSHPHFEFQSLPCCCNISSKNAQNKRQSYTENYEIAFFHWTISVRYGHEEARKMKITVQLLNHQMFVSSRFHVTRVTGAYELGPLANLCYSSLTSSKPRCSKSARLRID